MILKSPDGQELDFWSDPRLDPCPSKIVIRMSGGADSTALLMILCEHFKGHDVEFLPMLVEETPLCEYEPILEDILTDVRLKYPESKIAELDVMMVNDKGKDVDYFGYCESRGASIMVQGRTAAPIFDEVKQYAREDNTWLYHMEVRSVDSNTRDSKIWKSTYYREKDGIILYNPMTYVNKKFVAWIYEMWDARDILLKTSSCTRNYSHSTRKYGPCKECFHCMEKRWAFGMYDHGEM